MESFDRLTRFPVGSKPRDNFDRFLVVAAAAAADFTTTPEFEVVAHPAVEVVAHPAVEVTVDTLAVGKTARGTSPFSTIEEWRTKKQT